MIKNKNRLPLFVGFCGLFAGLGAFVWEMFGAVPCILCKVERLAFLFAAVVVLLSLAGFRKFFLSLGLASWISTCFVLLYHMGIQLRWFNVPQLCKASLPSGSVEELEKFLKSAPQSSCDTIEFSVLGLPPTFYLLGFAVLMAIMCWISLGMKTKKF
jgi:disulfide bond formation protein DsbB